MKKLFCICLSFILLMAMPAAVFADDTITYLDAISGEVIDESGETLATVRLSSTCRYNAMERMYVYTTDAALSTDVACSVYDGMITTDEVVIRPEASANIEVYRSGQLVDPSEYESLTEPGSYVVNNVLNSSELLAFTIVPYTTNAISLYRIPAIFYIVSARCNDKTIATEGNTVRFEEDGTYHIDYAGNRTDAYYSLDVHVDLTYPELIIHGVDEDGVARGPVSFDLTEDEAYLSVTVDGNPIKAVDGEYKTAGQYVVKYTDKAGNTSTYYFKMNVFFNVSAIIFVVVLGVVLVLAAGFVVYTRKNRRVR